MSPPDVAQILAALRERRDQPREAARAMPGLYYTSPDWLALEQEQLFRREWIAVGHVGEIPEVGDFYTTELIGEPLLIVRTATGIRTYANVCRHRGSVVARGKGRAQRFTCPYHAWTYGLDGRLSAAPLMADTALVKDECALPTVATELWQGFIFVNLSGSAPPLAPRLTGIDAMVANYQNATRHFLYGRDEVWDTNWKCLAENFMEGYDLSPLHARTLHAVTPTTLCEKLPHTPDYTGYRANFAPSCPERGPYPPTLTAKERRSDAFYWIYPGFVIGVCPHFTLYMCLRPAGVGQVAIRWGVTGGPLSPDDPIVTNYVALCDEFSAEDRAELEILWRGLHSRSYTPGPLAPDAFEGTIGDMIRYMASRFADHPAQ
jgi:nitrite reductase/ring-hydroxylating ferredoxin subunit